MANSDALTVELRGRTYAITEEWTFGGIRAYGSCNGRPFTAQVERLKRALTDGAMHHGFGTDLWTLPRIAQVIEKLFGVRYHPGHVWRVMHRLGWSLQRLCRNQAPGFLKPHRSTIPK